MARHGRDVTRNWNRLDLEQYYTDHQHLPSRETHGMMHVCTSTCQRVFVCGWFDEFTPNWNIKRTLLGGGRGRQWIKCRRVSSLQKCLLYSKRSTVLVGTAFSSMHTFHPALQIYDHTHVHVIIHAALWDRVKMKCVCGHNELHVHYWI